MTRPQFSVVIPTKNRSHIVSNAIQSVLWQTFVDYELVIVDNDDSDATRQVVEQFDDARIRYVRTGHLSMTDNWDTAIRAAQGEYVTVMADKNIFHSDALASIHKLIETHRSRIVTWAHDTYLRTAANLTQGYLETVKETDEQIYKLDSLPILQQTLGVDRPRLANDSKRIWRGYYLPRGYNSATHYTLVDEIVKKGGRACYSIAPDYTFGYAQLAIEAHLCYLDKVLTTVDKVESNGRDFVQKKDLQAIWESFGGEHLFYNAVQVKSASLLNNQIYNDFMNMQQKMGANLAHYPFDPIPYFLVLYSEINQRQTEGQTMTEEYTAWQHALQEQPQTVQQAIQERIRAAKPSTWNVMKHHIKQSLKQVVRPFQDGANPAPAPVFDSILDAAQYAHAAKNSETATSSQIQ